MKWLVQLISLLIPFGLTAQSSFRPPVDHPIRLSGTFGELRTGHFHTGIDIKAKLGVAGDPVLAVQNGTVSRLNVSSGGYGNVVYLDHPNGLTSVYAHLDRFSSSLQALVLAEQERTESYEVDIMLKAGTIMVDQGTPLGLMGNSGFSFGPHLHFELRETTTNTPINPLPFWTIPDRKKPQLREVFAHHLDHRGRLIKSTSLPLDQDTMVVDAWRVGIAVDAIDIFNSGRNKNGVYGLEILLDDQLAFALSFDSISLDNVDFRAHAHSEESSLQPTRKLHRCFLYGDYALRFGVRSSGSGVIPLFLDRHSKVTVRVADIHANVTEKTFYLSRAKDVSPNDSVMHQYYVQAGQKDTIQTQNFRILFDSLSLFHDVGINVNPDVPKSCLSAVSLETATPVLQSGVTIEYSSSQADSDILLTTWDIDQAPELHYYPSQMQEDILSARIWKLDKFCLTRDSIDPKIHLVGRKLHSSDTEYILTLTDNIKGISWVVRCEVDGKWVLHSFDAKQRQVRCRIPHVKERGRPRELIISATDAAGNTSIFRREIK